MRRLAIALLAAAAGAAPVPRTETAVFAGGCFWCVEADFEKLPGVLEAVSGYTGGAAENPSYEQVSSGSTGHAEAVRVTYDPARISYEALLEVFWRNIDPLTAGGQFCDRGTQYRSAIFAVNEAQARAAQASKARLKLPGPVVTEIVAASAFYPAEERHQDYYKKNPVRYRFYRASCGRDRRLKELWGGTTRAGASTSSP